MTPRPLKVVVVAFGAPHLLDRSLDGISPALPTTVVDNSSSSEIAAVARRRGAEYIDPGSNLGFGRGVNVALRPLLDGDPADVFVLNPDATISAADTLRMQRRLADGPDRIGVLSPALVTSCGAPQREVWPFPSPFRSWIEAIGLGRFNRGADFVVGTAMMLRWETIQDVGLFDEQFFLYAEETDWQRRAAQFRWTSAVCSEAVAHHVGGATSTHAQRRQELFHAGTETYVRKWFGPRGWFAYRSALVIGSLVRGAVLPGDRGAEARHRAALYLRGPRRVAGLTGP